MARNRSSSPVVTPTREGFGSSLKANAALQLGDVMTRKWKPAGLVVGVVFPLGPQRNSTRARADEADRVKKAGGVRFQNGPAV